MIRRIRSAVCFLIASSVIAGCSGGSPSSGDVEIPRNWPVEGLTLPAGVHDAQFSPGAVQQITSKLPRRKRYGTPRSKPPPQQWNAFFAYSGAPVKVFDHIGAIMNAKGYRVEDSRDLALGTENESRIRSYMSDDGAYVVSLRYWRVSDGVGKRPYQLLVQDVKSSYKP